MASTGVTSTLGGLLGPSSIIIAGFTGMQGVTSWGADLYAAEFKRPDPDHLENHFWKTLRLYRNNGLFCDFQHQAERFRSTGWDRALIDERRLGLNASLLKVSSEGEQFLFAARDNVKEQKAVFVENSELITLLAMTSNPLQFLASFGTTDKVVDYLNETCWAWNWLEVLNVAEFDSLVGGFRSVTDTGHLILHNNLIPLLNLNVPPKEETEGVSVQLKALMTYVATRVDYGLWAAVLPQLTKDKAYPAWGNFLKNLSKKEDEDHENWF